MKTFFIGGIYIRPLIIPQADIEILEISATNEGLGPGLHLHKKMEESFFIIEGSINFIVDGNRKELEKGEFFTVQRNTPHLIITIAWTGESHLA